MDIIAIKGIRPESLSRFLNDWWPLRGVVKKARGWVFIFVSGTEYFGTVSDYASLISTEMDKLVIYIRGESGVVDEFTIYDGGQLCPTSEEHARRIGKPRTHESWFIKNRLGLWGVSNEAQVRIRELLGESDVGTSGSIIRLPSSDSHTHQLAVSLFDSWRLPRVWS